SEAVDHDRDERSVAEPDDGRGVDRVEEFACLVCGENRGLTACDDVSWALDRVSRIRAHYPTRDEPVEESSDGGEMLLHRRRGALGGELFDVGRNDKRLDLANV